MFTLALTQIESSHFVPNLPFPPKPQSNWATRYVTWVRNADNFHPVWRIFVRAVAILLSFFLLASIVFSPVFIYLHKELISQNQWDMYQNYRTQLIKNTTDENRAFFLKGRLGLISSSSAVELSKETKEKMLGALRRANDDPISDAELFRMIALNNGNCLEEYGLKISSKSTTPSYQKK